MHEQEMWEEDLKQAIHQITPDAQQKEQMWDRLQHTISENGTQKQTAEVTPWRPRSRKTLAELV